MREHCPPRSLLLFTYGKLSSEYPNLVWRQIAPGLWQRNVIESSSSTLDGGAIRGKWPYVL